MELQRIKKRARHKVLGGGERLANDDFVLPEPVYRWGTIAPVNCGP